MAQRMPLYQPRVTFNRWDPTVISRQEPVVNEPRRVPPQVEYLRAKERALASKTLPQE